MKLRNNIWRTWLATIFGFVLPPGVACGQELPTLSLKNTEVKQLRAIADEPITGPVRCDNAGNIYLRTYEYPDPLAAPVRRFTQEGKRLPELSLSQREEFKNKFYQIRDFQTSASGNTFVLVTSNMKNEDGQFIGPYQVSVAEFNEDGKPDTVIRLDLPAGFTAGGELAVFPDGKFLVGGYKLVVGPGYVPQNGLRQPREVYIASFNRDGHLIAEFHPTPPPKREAATETNDARKTAKTGTQEKQSNDAPDDMVVGQDGRAYFFHKAAIPVIYVVTENGEFARQFFVPLPSPNAVPWQIRSLPGLKLLVSFVEDVSEDRSAGQINYFDIIDSQSGEMTSRYKLLPTEGGILACYSEPYDFVFLGGDPQGFTTIVHARPK